MALVLISWGQEEPAKALQELMLQKVASYHFTRGANVVYGYRWAKEGEEASSYDDKCWHLRDETDATLDHRGVSACSDMLEGIQAGWDLRGKCSEVTGKLVRPKAKKKPYTGPSLDELFE